MPPLGAQTSSEQSGKADCGGRLLPGPGRAAGTPRGAEPAGRQRAGARAAKVARGHTLGGPIRARRAVFRAARAHVGGGTVPGAGAAGRKKVGICGRPRRKGPFSGHGPGRRRGAAAAGGVFSGRLVKGSFAQDHLGGSGGGPKRPLRAYIGRRFRAPFSLSLASCFLPKNLVVWSGCFFGPVERCI